MIKYIVSLVSLLAMPALAAPDIGKPAPTFEAVDTYGKSVSLAGLKGSKVVLEWTNHKCPFVVKFYKPGEMQRLQKQATEKGIQWIRIISSAPGKQGHLDAEAANKLAQEQGVAAAHTILDPTGDIGRLYGAKTTPHMFVINEEGVLVYKGAIDDFASADSDHIANANNFVVAALDALEAGKMPEVQETRSYGCSVKY